MFYCEPCRKERNWPDSIGKSYGRCEVCGETRSCNDRAASTLPLPAVAKVVEESLDDIIARLQERINRL